MSTTNGTNMGSGREKLFDVPNLDGLSTDPADYTRAADAFARLARFCECKALAMEARQEGDILRASHNESRMEVLYTRLPKWARW